MEPGLGRRIADGATPGAQAQQRADIDDAAALPPRDHARRCLLRDEPGARKVGVDDATPVFFLRFQQPPGHGDAGIVDYGVDGAERFLGRIETCGDLSAVGHVHGNDRRAVDPGSHLGQRLHVPRRQRHTRARRRRNLGETPTEAARRAGDQHCPALEPQHSVNRHASLPSGPLLYCPPMLIEIFSDVICPWCFIGRRRLARALEARPGLDPVIRWRAFQLNPGMPPEGMARQDYLALKFGAQGGGPVYDRIRDTGRSEGIEFRFDAIERTPSTLAAHRLIRESGQRQTAVVDMLFDAYFLNGEDIGDTGQLADIASRAGWDRDEAEALLASDTAVQEVRQEDARARAMGIQGVPCFVVDRRYAISGAQEPEYFTPLFDLVQNGEAAAE